MSGFCAAPTYATTRRLEAADRRNTPGMPGPDGDPNEIPLSVQLQQLRNALEKLAAGQEVLQSSVTQVSKDVQSLVSSTYDSAASDKQRGGAAGGLVDAGAKASPRQSPRFRSKDARAKVNGTEPAASQCGILATKSVSVQDGSMISVTFAPVDEGTTKMKYMLQNLFLVTEAAEAKKAAMRENVKTLDGKIATLRSMDKPQLEMIIDSVMACVIVLNAIFLMIDADYNPTGKGLACNIVNYFFSAVFVLELTLKLSMLGFRGQYCRNGRFANIFDSTLILIDVFQMFLTMIAVSLDFPASVLRLARLLRIGRILRLFRMNIFANLLAMISGLIGGMPTLAWSVVLFMIVMYVLALVFRETLGTHTHDFPDTAVYFANVPRAMFTVFRCSFGDCATKSGTPLFEYVHDEFGSFFTLLYVMMTFAVTVGLFNVISAIFVESTMAAATAGVQVAKGERLQDQNLWARCITQIVRATMLQMTGALPAKLSDVVDEVFELEIQADAFEELVKLPTIIAALDDLDINPDDHRFLPDILDPDNGGSITVGEIVDGLARLRGDPRRSDIVAVDLMIRSLQGQIGEILGAVKPLSSQTPSRGSSNEAELALQSRV